MKLTLERAVELETSPIVSILSFSQSLDIVGHDFENKSLPCLNIPNAKRHISRRNR